ncbi:putative cardiolipin synthase [Burkholderiales bacterium 8X]|nr:putative cardiolipin synthase [Burkholderiales bacterium 8X]
MFPLILCFQESGSIIGGALFELFAPAGRRYIAHPMIHLHRWKLASALAAWLGLLVGCTVLPAPLPREPSFARTDLEWTSLARTALQAAPPESTGWPIRSGFRLLPEAPFAFDARIALIRRAEATLDVQYYLIEDDEVGLLFLRELRDAAARGVRVRLLMDDLYTGGKDQLLGDLAAHPNIDLRLFNPLPSRSTSLGARILWSLHEFSRINHRMHNKLLVADGSFAVSGGRNIASEYFMNATAANFIDVDLLSVGPVVKDMSNAFDRYWNSEHVRAVGEVVPGTLSSDKDEAMRRFDRRAAAASPDIRLRERDVMGQGALGPQIDAGRPALTWAPARFYADEPDKIARATPEEAFRGSVTEGALDALRAAHREAAIISPYFIPGERGMAIMRQAMAQGGQIVIITNSLGATDEPLVYAGYANYRAEMLKLGIIIREIAPVLTGKSGNFGDFGQSISRLHAKLTFIDRRRIFIGSMNLDRRSAAINTEAAMLIDSAELVEAFGHVTSSMHGNAAYRLRLAPGGERVQWLASDSDGKDIVYLDEPDGSAWLRFKNWLLLPWVGEHLL